MNNRVVLVYFVLLTMSVSAIAQTSTATISPEPVNQTTGSAGSLLGNKKFEDDKDITDSKLKADSGSLSRYSMKLSFSMDGPPVGDLGNKNQPNPDGSIGKKEVRIGGSVSARYRIDKTSAIGVGTGINILTPFHKVERVDVKTPFISYDKNSRWNDIQIRNSYGASVTTVPDFREVGQYGSLSYDNSLIYNIGTSGFAAGLDTGLSVFLYERGYDAKKDRTAGRYHLGFYPQIKYNFSDKVNVYTSVALNYINQRKLENEFQLANNTLSSRLGMGMAFSKTVYFAPYLNFYPNDFNWKSTTLSFATIFSVL